MIGRSIVDVKLRRNVDRDRKMTREYGRVQCYIQRLRRSKQV